MSAPHRSATSTTEWRKDPNGYVRRQIRNPLTNAWTTQSQHRHIMEQHLGRPLLKTETVHHLNGQRDQNNIENLQLWSTHQPAGQRIEDKVRWAYELIDRYDPEGLMKPPAG